VYLARKSIPLRRGLRQRRKKALFNRSQGMPAFLIRKGKAHKKTPVYIRVFVRLRDICVQIGEGCGNRGDYASAVSALN
jgi:hypothetical protein